MTATQKQTPAPEPRPEWLKVRYTDSAAFNEVAALTKRLNLTTVCEEARCPNIHECWGKERTATFMIMGEICTRRCMFCNVTKGQPPLLDPREPANVAEAVATLGLKHVVITQVNRDDLPDEGAAHFAKTIHAIREQAPGCRVELLISDLEGNWDALETLLEARPDVLGHNTECVPRLYKRVRPFAVYERTVELLARSAANNGDRISATKSGIMVGLGETLDEVFELMQELRDAGVDFFTVGQYLQPSPKHLRIERYYTPDEFTQIREHGDKIGFIYTEAGPLVRSSYHAGRAAEALDRHLAAQKKPAASP